MSRRDRLAAARRARPPAEPPKPQPRRAPKPSGPQRPAPDAGSAAWAAYARELAASQSEPGAERKAETEAGQWAQLIESLRPRRSGWR